MADERGTEADEATPLDVGSLRLPDGRTMAWTVWGDPDGIPILYQPHLGTTGRRARTVDIRIWRDAGLRLVVLTRAGLGSSSRHPGRDAIGDASDTAAVADGLGLDRVNLVGQCGGSGAILAFAATRPDRVSTVTLGSPAAPLRASGTDTFMTPNLRGIRRILRFGPVARAYARGRSKALLRDPDGFIDRSWRGLPDADRAVVDDRLERDLSLESMRDFYAVPYRFVDEWRAAIGPWPFDLSEVGSPVVIDHGALDRSMPVGMARWIAQRLPAAELHVDATRGHLMSAAQATAFVAGIAARARSAASAADGSAAGG